MRRLGVVLLSGGLDSTTVAALAIRQGYELYAVTVYYGQAHQREVTAARRVAQALGIEQRVVDASFFRELAWYSALTQPDRFSIPEGRSAETMAENIPITYVPLRNTLLLALGAAFLESVTLQTIEVQKTAPRDVEAVLFIAANAIDYSGYPDCRPEYYEALIETLRLGSKIGTQYGVSFRVETPLIDKTKMDIVRLAISQGAPVEYSWSCYQGGVYPCGLCDSCLLRAKGFSEAGVPDPALTSVQC